MSAEIVQFFPFSSVVDTGFWHILSSQKLDKLKLNNEAIPIYASYRNGRLW